MFHNLKIMGDSFYITNKREYICNSVLYKEDVEECFDFAYEMTFGQKGAHRNYRSGGQARRNNGEVFIDAFQGKLAEFAFYNYCCKYPLDINKPDLEVMGLNKWDTSDFEVNGYSVAVKSTKSYGQLLLLETKDWNDEGLYIPNYGTGHEKYDFFVLIRVSPDGKTLMKKNRMLYSINLDKNNLAHSILEQEWQCNIVGFITLAIK